MRLPRGTRLLSADSSPPPQATTGSRQDGGYWLSHCEGFAVDSPQGLVGVVESMVYASDQGQPAYLALRADT